MAHDLELIKDKLPTEIKYTKVTDVCQGLRPHNFA